MHDNYVNSHGTIKLHIQTQQIIWSQYMLDISIVQYHQYHYNHITITSITITRVKFMSIAWIHYDNTLSGYWFGKSIQRQKGLIISHINILLDPFASKLKTQEVTWLLHWYLKLCTGKGAPRQVKHPDNEKIEVLGHDSALFILGWRQRGRMR